MIDFVAYHNLQAQCGQSLFNELVRVDRCQWRVNGNQTYTGSDTLIMLDHAPHHPDLIGKYKYRFWFPHDMGEVLLHYKEQEANKDYTAYFVPTVIHLATFTHMFGHGVYNVGWLKYDDMGEDDDAEAIIKEAKGRGLPIVLYAPTNPDSWEWTALLRQLKKYTVIIKNHILTNPGQPVPAHQEEHYANMFRSVDQMEAWAARHDMIVAPRGLNACTLFNAVDYLISDTSSLLAEFTPFGVSIETGRVNQDKTRIIQDMSYIF